MRRFKFTTQLAVLFCMLLLISLCLFGIITIGRFNNISEAETFDRLEGFVILKKADWKEGKEVDFTNSNLDVGYIQGVIETQGERYIVSKNSTHRSSNMRDFLTEYQEKDVVLSINCHPGASGKNISDLGGLKKIYYYYSVDVGSDGTIYYFILLTNQQFARSFRNRLSVQIIAIFSVVFMFSFILIGLWGSGYVSRITRIEKHIAALPQTSYEEVYQDDGKDELAFLSRSIEQMRLEIKKNEMTKQEMLQNISHDFKTPIAVIKSYSEAIEDGMASIKDAKIIYDQATILQHKVNKLLQYNRLEYLEKKEPFKECEMKEIITSIVNTYRYQIKDIEFKTSLDDTKFKGYEENFYTVVDNIIDNAKRYAKSVIKITLKNGVLDIYNDGEPIDEQFLNGYFKAYEKGSKGQFGLGMSIVKKTLDFFGYELSVKNEKVGVTFTIKKKIVQNIYTQ